MKRVFMRGKASKQYLYFSILVFLLNTSIAKADEVCFSSVAPRLASFKTSIHAFLGEISPLLNRRTQEVVDRLRSTAGEEDVTRLVALDQEGKCSELFQYRQSQQTALHTHPASAPHWADLLPQTLRMRQARLAVSSALYARCSFKVFASKVDHTWSSLPYETVMEELRALQGFRQWLNGPAAASISFPILDGCRSAVSQIPALIQAIERACSGCATDSPEILDRRNSDVISALNQELQEAPAPRHVIDSAAERRRTRWQQQTVNSFMSDLNQDITRIRPLEELVTLAQQEEQETTPLLSEDYVGFALEAEIGFAGTPPEEAFYDFSVNRSAWELKKQAMLGSVESIRNPRARREALLTALRASFTDQPTHTGMADALAHNGGNDEVRTWTWLSVLSSAGNVLGRNESLGVQVFQDRVVPVLVDRSTRPPKIQDLLTGEFVQELRGPIYRPQVLWAAFLEKAKTQRESVTLPVATSTLVTSTDTPLASHRNTSERSRSEITASAAILRWPQTAYQSTPVPVAPPATTVANQTPQAQAPAVVRFASRPIGRVRTHDQLVAAAIASLASPPPGSMDFDYAEFFLEVQSSDASAEHRQENYAQAVRKYRETLDLILTRIQDVQDPLERIKIAMDLLRERHLHTYNQNEAGILGGLTGASGFNVQGQTAFILGALQSLGLSLPAGFQIGVQVYEDTVKPVLYHAQNGRTYDLLYDRTDNVLQAPVYQPGLFLHAFVQNQRRRVRHQNPVEAQQLLVASPERGIPNESFTEHSRIMGRRNRQLSWPDSRNRISLEAPPKVGNITRGSNGRVTLAPLPLQEAQRAASSSRRSIGDLIRALRELRASGHSVGELLRMARAAGVDVDDIPPEALEQLQNIPEDQIETLMNMDPAELESMVQSATENGDIEAIAQGDWGDPSEGQSSGGDSGDSDDSGSSDGGSSSGGGGGDRPGLVSLIRDRIADRRADRADRREDSALNLIYNATKGLSIANCDRLFRGETSLRESCVADIEQTARTMPRRRRDALRAIFALCLRTQQKVLSLSEVQNPLFSGQGTAYPTDVNTKLRGFSCQNPENYESAEPSNPLSVSRVTVTGLNQVGSDEFMEGLTRYIQTEALPPGLAFTGYNIDGMLNSPSVLRRCQTVQTFFNRNYDAFCRAKIQDSLDYALAPIREMHDLMAPTDALCLSPDAPDRTWLLAYCDVGYHAPPGRYQRERAEGFLSRLSTTAADQSLYTASAPRLIFEALADQPTASESFLRQRIRSDLNKALRPLVRRWVGLNSQIVQGQTADSNAEQAQVLALLEKCKELTRHLTNLFVPALNNARPDGSSTAVIQYHPYQQTAEQELCTPDPALMAPLERQLQSIRDRVAANPEGLLLSAAQMAPTALNDFMRIMGASPNGRISTDAANRIGDLLSEPGRVIVGEQSRLTRAEVTPIAVNLPQTPPPDQPPPVPNAAPDPNARYVTIHLDESFLNQTPTPQATGAPTEGRRRQRADQRIFLSPDRMAVLLLNTLSQQNHSDRRIFDRWTPQLSAAVRSNPQMLRGRPDLAAALLAFEDRQGFLGQRTDPCLSVSPEIAVATRDAGTGAASNLNHFAPPGPGDPNRSTFQHVVVRNYTYLRSQFGVSEGCSAEAETQALGNLLLPGPAH